MGIWEHQNQFDGKPVVDFEPEMSLQPETTNYRVRVDYDSQYDFTELFAQFVSTNGANAVTGLITGMFSDEMYDESMAPVIEAVIAAAEQLPSLTGLFFGDITAEENEISWIQQTDVSPVWQAFPRLRTLQIRGGENLSLGTITHDQLQALIIETGGLPASVVQQIASAKLPELQHLELLLGDDGYGGDSTIEDIRPLLNRELFPKLKYFGLKNSEYQDQIAQALAESEIAEQLEVIDMSLGTLSDEGARPILDNMARFKSLKSLDVSHNYLSEMVCKELSALPIETNISDQDVADDDGDRYVSIGE